MSSDQTNSRYGHPFATKLPRINELELPKSIIFQLQDIADIKTGKLDSNAAIDDGDFPFFTCAPLPLRINEFAFNEEAILLAGNNANGVFHLNRYSGKFNAYQRTYVITPKRDADIDIGFLFYTLKTVTGRLSEFSQGTATKFLTKAILNPLPIAVPDIEQQRSIGEVLGSLDTRIVLLSQKNETLEALARAIFKSWFVDFDPVRAKAEGREPEGMDAATAALFPSEFQDSELGPIPRGWSVGRFVSLVEIVKDSVNPLKHPEEVFELFSLPGFDEGRKASLQTGSEIKSNKTIVPGGAVLLSKLNPSIERVWAPYLSGANRSVCSTEFLVLKGQAQASTAFVYCLTRSSGFREMLLSLTTGTSNSHQRVRMPDLQASLVVMPEESVHRAFAEIATPLLQRRNDNLSLIETLASLRDTLLPRLISGKLRVPEAEAMLAEAL